MSCKREVICPKCGKNHERRGTGTYCRECNRDYMRDYTHKNGLNEKLSQSKDSPSWLGCYIAEKVLSQIFNEVDTKPYGNKGYDFVCSKGKKVDVKSACYLPGRVNRNYRWYFSIKRNKVPDYFLLIAFDSREDLNPVHIWLIPAIKINGLKNLAISAGKRSLEKWKLYEKPTDKAVVVCENFKANKE